MKINKKHQLLSVLLLALFLSFQAGVSLFAHTHLINGIALVHSHPSADANRIHTSAQAYAIAFISTIHCDDIPELPTTPTPFEATAKIGNKITPHYHHIFCGFGINFRAPPYC